MNIKTNLSMDDLYNQISNLPNRNNMSLICFDSNFEKNNKITKLIKKNVIKNMIVITSKNNKSNIPNLCFIKKPSKRKLVKNINTPSIIYISLKNTIDTKYIKKIINSLILLYKIFESSNTKPIFYIDYTKSNEYYYSCIYHTLKALSYCDLKSQYEYIYNTVCNELDKDFIKNNYCDFKNNQCIANRLHKSVHDTMGCCYSFNYSSLGNIENVKLCQYLKDKKCETACISCKLFTCRYLKNKGIKFRAKDNILLSCFFNKKQLRILSCNFFIKKEKIISKLLQKDNMPYIFFYLLNKEYIK